MKHRSICMPFFTFTLLPNLTAKFTNKSFFTCLITSLLMVFLVGLLSSTALAVTTSELSSNKQTITIPQAQGDIVLDGKLDDALWQHAQLIDLNIVNSPRNNTPSPIKTTAKIIENGEYLFIAFIAQDPEPENILAYYADRDTRWDDDLVGIKLDPQHNYRLNYEFIVNPLGIQMDGIKNHITGERNDLWDGIWHSFGRITDTGYIVEMKIPFNILNFPENQKIKQWPFELFRIYPRDTWLRISHVPIDKNNACIACQYPLAQGFKNTSAKKNIMVTPAVVAKSTQNRNIYQPDANWQHNNEVELSTDIRWNINSNTVINATINPDFSFIEADAAKLNVNENFSLNYAEKRSFFLENSEYFASNFNLIYTRNITAPNYGVKITGAKAEHTYGAFISQDSKTQFILPGNLSSDVASIDDESLSGAVKYRFDTDKNLSLGLISTFRRANNYHNYLVGIDTKYQLTESNSFLAQILSSETEYPENLFQDFCTGAACIAQLKVACFSLACPYNEQVSRARKQQSFSDKAYKIDFQHRSEYWQIDASHQTIGENFRADLGFMPRTDIKENNIAITRKFFSKAENAHWQEASVAGNWYIIHNQNNELIEKSLSTTATIDGPWRSHYQLTLSHSEEVGLRYDQSITKISGNTSRFTLDKLKVSTAFKPVNNLHLEFSYLYGDDIDYIHNRQGDSRQFESYFSWFATKHLEWQVTYIDSRLQYQHDNVFEVDLIDSRVSYQFNARSQLKLNTIYYDVKRPLDNNPSNLFDARTKELSTQLLYSYKINPQTVFYLGYSDSQYQDDNFNTLTKDNKTFFSKVSYAWMP